MTIHLAVPLKADFVIVKYQNNGTQTTMDDMIYEIYYDSGHMETKSDMDRE